MLVSLFETKFPRLRREVVFGIVGEMWKAAYIELGAWSGCKSSAAWIAVSEASSCIDLKYHRSGPIFKEICREETSTPLQITVESLILLQSRLYKMLRSPTDPARDSSTQV